MRAADAIPECSKLLGKTEVVSVGCCVDCTLLASDLANVHVLLWVQTIIHQRLLPGKSRHQQLQQGLCCHPSTAAFDKLPYYVQIAYPFIYGMPPLNWLLRKLRPNQGVRVLVPSPLLRAVTFKLFVDMSQIPALQHVFSTGLRVLFNGDKSQWDRALQMPHYSTASMPAISWHTGMHFGQVRSLDYYMRLLDFALHARYCDNVTRSIHQKQGILVNCTIMYGLCLAETSQCCSSHSSSKPLARIVSDAAPALEGVAPFVALLARSRENHCLTNSETRVLRLQWCKSSKFRMYDMGSSAQNQQEYGQAEPPDVAASYHLLDFPIDIMAGKADGIIARENVLMHYEAMRNAGCCVTYKEFDFGHLDFTFAIKDDLRSYVISRLRMPI